MKFRKRDNCYYLSTFNKERWEHTDWIIFYWGWRFDISFEICGYFDNRPRINLDLIFFSLSIILPFRNKWTDECNAPKWGIQYHNQTLWIMRGGKGNMNGGNKWWTFHVPWSWEWVRTSNLKKDGTWEHEKKGDKKNFYEDKWKEVIWSESYPYTYILRSGKVQERIATVKVEEREWRWRGAKWSKWPRMIRKSLAVDFNDEVGERSGSWKGGTIGCGYEMKHGELPEQTLRRMEKERKF